MTRFLLLLEDTELPRDVARDFGVPPPDYGEGPVLHGGSQGFASVPGRTNRILQQTLAVSHAFAHQQLAFPIAVAILNTAVVLYLLAQEYPALPFWTPLVVAFLTLGATGALAYWGSKLLNERPRSLGGTVVSTISALPVILAVVFIVIVVVITIVMIVLFIVVGFGVLKSLLSSSDD